jgi:hypothetical protein
MRWFLAVDFDEARKDDVAAFTRSSQTRSSVPPRPSSRPSDPAVA